MCITTLSFLLTCLLKFPLLITEVLVAKIQSSRHIFLILRKGLVYIHIFRNTFNNKSAFITASFPCLMLKEILESWFYLIIWNNSFYLMFEILSIDHKYHVDFYFDVIFKSSHGKTSASPFPSCQHHISKYFYFPYYYLLNRIIVANITSVATLAPVIKSLDAGRIYKGLQGLPAHLVSNWQAF